MCPNDRPIPTALDDAWDAAKANIEAIGEAHFCWDCSDPRHDTIRDDTFENAGCATALQAMIMTANTTRESVFIF